VAHGRTGRVNNEEFKGDAHVILGGKPFYVSDLACLIPSKFTRRDVKVLTTSCYGGRFISDKWTAFTVATSSHLSYSFSRSVSDRYRGGPWAAVVWDTAMTGGKAMDGDLFGQEVQQKTPAILSSHPVPQYQLKETDQGGDIQKILGYEHPACIITPTPRDDGDGALSASASGTASKRLNSYLERYTIKSFEPSGAPYNQELSALISRHTKGLLNSWEVQKLTERLSERQADDMRAISLVQRLGILPGTEIENWVADPKLCDHEMYEVLLPWMRVRRHIVYDKPAMFVIDQCIRWEVDVQLLETVVKEILNEEAEGRGGRREHSGRRTGRHRG
jgi:hypothetical protein